MRLVQDLHEGFQIFFRGLLFKVPNRWNKADRFTQIHLNRHATHQLITHGLHKLIGKYAHRWKTKHLIIDFIEKLKSDGKIASPQGHRGVGCMRKGFAKLWTEYFWLLGRTLLDENDGKFTTFCWYYRKRLPLSIHINKKWKWVYETLWIKNLSTSENAFHNLKFTKKRKSKISPNYPREKTSAYFFRYPLTTEHVCVSSHWFEQLLNILPLRHPSEM